MYFGEKVVIDGKGHISGRLATIVAKELLLGRNVVVVRCEQINISGTMEYARKKYSNFLRKRCITNPRKGPFHHRAPSKIFMRVVRGMLPWKTPRGKLAFKRLKAFEGVPIPYDRQKRYVVPKALRALSLRQSSKYCVLGDISKIFGWKYSDIVEQIEEKRKSNAQSYFENKVQQKNKRDQAIETFLEKNADVRNQIAEINKKLEILGY